MKKKKPLSERLPASQFIALLALLYMLVTGLGFALPYLMLPSANTTLYIATAYMLNVLLIIGQSLILKFQFRWAAHRWILASAIGAIFIVIWNIVQSMLLSNLLFSFNNPLIYSIIIGGVTTFIMGLAQSLLLRQYVKRAWAWIIALLSAELGVFPLYDSMYASSYLGAGALIMLVGAIKGMILGMVLTMLLRHTIKSDDQMMTSDSQAHSNTDYAEEPAGQVLEFADEDVAKLQQSSLSRR